MNYAARRARLQDRLEREGLDALLVTRLTNIRYLTGFTGTTAHLLAGAAPLIVVDFRYRSQVREEVDGVEIRDVESARALWPEVQRTLATSGLRRVGVEADTLGLGQYLDLNGGGGVELVPTRGLVEELRARKEQPEIDAMREAVRIADETMDEILDVLRPGLSEHRVAGEIELRQRSKGGERSASEIIVASGERTTRPHGLASAKTIGAGEPVMFDLGTVVDGYLSDLTRTVHLGRASDEFRRIYGIVLEAQRAVEERIRPGMRCSEADAIAREIIAAEGYGDRFGHSLGHSIGLDNHEAPRLGPGDETVLEPGMVTTVEPGIYVPGVGGVRIEDMVVITDDGCEILTRNRKELVEL